MGPVLWHIDVSHYSEKARWALDFKRVAHVRRAPVPGLHVPLALCLTRGRSATLPILQLDGQVIGDSSAIIAALERGRFEPALYPEDEVERERALALEDWFDTQLGPFIRRLAWHELRRDRDALGSIAAESAPAVAAVMGPALVPYARALTAVRYGAASDRRAADAKAMVLAALERLEAELAGGDYLVGGRFTVADLTAASLFYPLVLPEGAPAAVRQLPEPFERFRASVVDRPGYKWVQEMYARHRDGAGA